MRERIGKFEIVRMLGHGSMGEVYLAKDPLLDRAVAVKTIRLNASFAPDANARFEREARSAGSLNHPNIVTVFEFGEDEGTHFLAMEYVDGEDLGAAIRSGAHSREDLLELLAQACDGLAFAHEHGIIHRDIKPANILVSRLGRKAQAKLMDFGVAGVEQSELTQKGNWMGTASYMAPEYLDTGKALPASDLFAMGVVLYEILTGGRRPFAGETPASILGAILGRPPAPFTPAELAGLSPALLAVADRALAKAPGERFPSAEALAEAIREAAAAPFPKPADTAGLRTLMVGKGGKAQCMSLRVALRQAEPGTRIVVLPGVYRESLVVDKDVTIEGQGEASEVVIESPKGPCLVLDAGDVRLCGLTLRSADSAAALLALRGRIVAEGCAFDVAGGPAIQIAGGAVDPTFLKCSVRGAAPAAVLAEANTLARLEACDLAGDFLAAVRVGAGARVLLNGCRLTNPPGVGVHLLPGAQATLEDCQVSGQAAGGIEVEAEARAELRRCRVMDSRSIGVLVLERGQATLDDCDLGGHALSAVHGAYGATITLRRCRMAGNYGLGSSIMDQGLLAMEDCELSGNQEPAVVVHNGATAQLKSCRIFDGRSFGVVCSWRGRGVLEGCEIFGNAGTGAKVEPGGSLLLVRCDLRDGKDTGILLLEDAEVTLEECVVHRNARGGILLAKDASDPILRGGNRLQDDLIRTTASGEPVKVAPVRKA
ncbi:protein kinase [Geothrix sp. 21YS21S-2]|uniref:protein kinase domain-containing protein n=1 Tax=Geothrix sp. 21YS21S-2 TaxID=3068893 RepID=UPI0027B964D4|nr:protein kinase [Geothrix sp. 21YS21S-2]